MTRKVGYRLWQRVKDAARKELASGHRAARTIEHDSRPWERAQFLALRAAFREEWQPRGGVEAALIDAMAQAYTGYLTWLERLDVQATSEGSVEDHQLKERGYYLTPRVTTAKRWSNRRPWSTASTACSSVPFGRFANCAGTRAMSSCSRQGRSTSAHNRSTWPQNKAPEDYTPPSHEGTWAPQWHPV